MTNILIQIIHADTFNENSQGCEENYGNGNQFIPLDGLGHCPQDEAPEVVNPILLQWIERQLTNNNLG